MRAMILEKPGTALRESEVVKPSPGAGQVLVKVLACAVCRTDLHIIDGELPNPKLPLIPGHEIAASAVEPGTNVDPFDVGDRAGRGARAARFSAFPARAPGGRRICARARLRVGRRLRRNAARKARRSPHF